MPKKINQEFARSLVLDSKIMRLSDAETLVYMKSKNCAIGQAKLTSLKKEIDEDPSLKAWIAQQANVGFVIAQRDMIREIDIISERLMRMYIMETSKADYIPIDDKKPMMTPLGAIDFHNAKKNPHKNVYLILKIAERLESLNGRKQDLQLGNPIIANVKTEMDKLRRDAAQSPDTGKKDIYAGLNKLIN